MLQINEQEAKSLLDILSQLDRERTEACIMIGEIKAIMELCSERTACKRQEDEIEWYLVFSNLGRLAVMIEERLLEMEAIMTDRKGKYKEGEPREEGKAS